MAKKSYDKTLEGRTLESLFKKTGNGLFLKIWVGRFEKYHFGK